MKPIPCFLTLFFIILILGCKDDKPTEEIYIEPSVSTYYFIRHAEKDRTNQNEVDPELSQKGLGRAMHWAEILKDVDISAVYSTDYQRTTMTAAPLAVKKDITVQYYDLKDLDIAQFMVDNLDKNVVVIGHKNTIPQLVNKIIGEDKYGEMDDSDNGSLYIVQLINDTTTDMHLEFNCNCPD